MVTGILGALRVRDQGGEGQVIDVAREVLDAYGYRELRPPLFEETRLFVRSIGEVTDVTIGGKPMQTVAIESADLDALRATRSALGLDEFEARRCVRFSFGAQHDESELVDAAHRVARVVAEPVRAVQDDGGKNHCLGQDDQPARVDSAAFPSAAA